MVRSAFQDLHIGLYPWWIGSDFAKVQDSRHYAVLFLHLGRHSLASSLHWETQDLAELFQFPHSLGLVSFTCVGRREVYELPMGCATS